MDILNRKLYEWEKKISSHFPVEFIESASLPKDAFSIQYRKSCLQIRYSHLPAALFAAKKGPLPKGEYHAKNPWRIIDPSCFVDESFLIQLIEEGFNAIILDPDQENIAVLAKEMGIKVLLKIVFPKDYCSTLPFDENYPEMIEKFISHLRFSYDALYWQSPYFEHACKQYLLEKFKLKHELYLEEIKCLESHATVFYPCPDQNFSVLEQHAGPNIHIVHQDQVPCVLGMNVDVPLIYCENNRRIFQKLKKGAIVQVDAIWEEGSYYACHMESAGAALWGVTSFEETCLAWFKTHRKELNADEERHLLTTLARFSSKFRYFEDVKSGKLKKPAEEIKMQVEGLAAEKKLLQYHLQMAQKNQQGRFFSEIETYLDELTTLSQEVLKR